MELIEIKNYHISQITFKKSRKKKELTRGLTMLGIILCKYILTHTGIRTQLKMSYVLNYYGKKVKVI
jgi:hypothetical protein